MTESKEETIRYDRIQRGDQHDNTCTHHVFHSSYDLCKQRPRLFLRQTSLVWDLSEEFASRCVLHDEVQLCQRLNNLVKTDDVWVMKPLHAWDLSWQQTLRLLVKFCLVENLDCDFLCNEEHMLLGVLVSSFLVMSLIWCSVSHMLIRLHAITCWH